MIDITVLGTAALFPLPDRALTAVQLVCGGHSILFDCGEGTQTAARKAGVSLMKTDVIALTHYHGDHIFGLPGLLQTMFSMGRTEPLYILGPAGIETQLAPVMTLAGELSFEVRLLELGEEGIELNTLRPGWPDGAGLTPFRTNHRVISQGYVFTLPRAGKFHPDRARLLNVPQNQWGRLQRGETVTLAKGCVITPDMVLGPARQGLKVVFSGDTALCYNLIHAAEKADLLICEATYGENEQEQLARDHGHMIFSQAARAAAEAEVKRLWLVHYSQMITDPEEYLPNAATIFPETECGTDGKRITLKFPE